MRVQPKSRLQHFLSAVVQPTTGALLLACVLVVSLVACDDDPVSDINDEPEPSEEIDVSVDGTVTSEQTGYPVEDAEVTVYAATHEGPLDEATTDGDGNYAIAFTIDEDDAPDELEIEVMADDFESTDVTVPFAENITEDIALLPREDEVDAISIGSIEELQDIGRDGDYPLDADYIVENDLDATGTADWNDGQGFEPIGSESDPFIGTIDGNGYVISGLTIDRPDEAYIGIFANASGATLENLVLEDSDLDGLEYIGALAGEVINTVVRGIHVTGSVRAHGEDRANRAGGILGRLEEEESRLEDSSADVSVTGFEAVGGLVGFVSEGEIQDVSVEGVVGKADDARTRYGGVVGWAVENVTIRNATSSAEVTPGEEAGEVGGVAGNCRCRIEDSSASGAVEGRSSTGGLVGNMSGDDDSGVFNSSASGDVVGFTIHVGGLVGHLQQGVVQESHALGEVVNIGFDSGRVGGLIGAANSGTEVIGSYAEGNVTDTTEDGVGAGADGVGGLIGRSSATIKDAYATGTVGGSPNWIPDQVRLGGLVGEQRGTPIEARIVRSYATGDVMSKDGAEVTEGMGRDRLGGLVGQLQADVSVEESFATGDVLARSDQEVHVGGLVGETRDESSSITNSYATGDVSWVRSADEIRAGGLVGENVVEITNSFSAGTVSTAEDTQAGGFAGTDSSSMDGSYWDVPASGKEEAVPAGDASGVEGLGDLDDTAPADEMTGDEAAEYMDAFDFEDVWQTTDGYPELRSIE